MKKKTKDRIKTSLKYAFGFLFSPFLLIIIASWVFQIKRYPEIWTTHNILVFLAIAIPLNIILGIIYYYMYYRRRFKK